MQFTVFLIYIWIFKPGRYQTSKLVQYIIGIRIETRQKINLVHCSRGIYLTFFIFIKLCLLV